MQIKQKTGRSLIFITFTEFYGFLSNFLILYFLIYILTSTEFAYYSFSISFLSFFAIFANFGLGTTMIQFLSRMREKNFNEITNLISEGFKLSFLITLIVSLVLFLTASFIEELYNMPGLGLIIQFVSIYLFFTNLIYFFECIFQGLWNFKVLAISNITSNTLKLIIVLFNLILKLQIFLLIALFSLVSMIQFLVIIILIQIKYKYFSNLISIDLSSINELLKFSSYIFFPIFFLYLITQFNQFILAFYVIPSELANYIITLLIIQFLSIPALIFAKLIYPYASYYINLKENGKDKVNLIFNLNFKYGLLIMLPISFYFFLFSDYLIVFVFSSDYQDVSSYLKIFIFYINIKIIDVVGGHLLWASNEHKLVLKLYTITAISTILLSLLLIPYYLTYGAILSIIIPHSSYVLYSIYLVKKKNSLKIEPYTIRAILIYLLSSIVSIVMTLLIIFIFEIKLNEIIYLISLTILYYGFYTCLILILKGISLNEIIAFINSFRCLG